MDDLGLWDLGQYRIQGEEDAKKVIHQVYIYLVRLQKQLAAAARNLMQAIGSRLWSRVKELGKMLNQAFTVDSMQAYAQASAIYGESLAGELYQLYQRFLQLRLAIIGAAAPIMQALLPAMQSTAAAATKLINLLGQVLRGFFQGTQATDGYTSSMEQASAAGKQLRKTLAGFDQLNRLGEGIGSGGGFMVQNQVAALSDDWKKLVEQMQLLVKPFKELDFSGAAKSLERLKKALEPLTKTLFEGLDWAYRTILLPMAQWTAEILLPTFLDALTASVRALGATVEQLRPTLSWLWEECLQPLAQWAGDKVIGYLQGITHELGGVSGWIDVNRGGVKEMISSAEMILKTLGSMTQKFMGWSEATDSTSLSVETLVGKLTAFLSEMDLFGVGFSLLSGVLAGVAEAFGLIDSASTDAWGNLKAVWEGAWSWLKEKTMDPTFAGVRDTVNGIISLINAVMRGVAMAVNAVSECLNAIDFTLPDWIPILGGKRFRFNLGTVSAPQIPYLAQGAVLPANKPFLAVVGDQHHGTNVEAPLATIQQAVAEVMHDAVSGNMAGHEATVAVLRELLAAVQCLHITDEELAGAVNRYNQKVAVIRGGVL